MKMKRSFKQASVHAQYICSSHIFLSRIHGKLQRKQLGSFLLAEFKSQGWTLVRKTSLRLKINPLINQSINQCSCWHNWDSLANKKINLHQRKRLLKNRLNCIWMWKEIQGGYIPSHNQQAHICITHSKVTSILWIYLASLLEDLLADLCYFLSYHLESIASNLQGMLLIFLGCAKFQYPLYSLHSRGILCSKYELWKMKMCCNTWCVSKKFCVSCKLFI